MNTATADLAKLLVAYVSKCLGEVASTVAPTLELPASYAGHAVNDATRADLLYVLALLVEAGVEELADVKLRERAQLVLRDIDPIAIEGFWSYRVAEAVQHLGGLAAFPRPLRARAIAAASSPRLLDDVLSDTPTRRPNLLAVAARCLHAESRLQESEAPPSFELVLSKLRTLVSASGTGWINDGLSSWTQYDIYTPDIYLMLEPVASKLGFSWREGFLRVTHDLDDLALPGGAVVWGRSTGILAHAVGLQLAGLLANLEKRDLAVRWLARVPGIIEDLPAWFDSGVVNAHLRRGVDSYRGPNRRLQLTFDFYGKMLLAAQSLRKSSMHVDLTVPDAYPGVDRLVRFSKFDGSSAWVHRSRDLAFVLPLMRGESASYVSSPRNPLLFDQPVEPLPVMVPMVVRPEGMMAPQDQPLVVEHQHGRLVTRQSGWAPVGADDLPEVAGDRTTTYVVEGRKLSVSENLLFDDEERVTIAIPSRSGVPLHVTVDGAAHVFTSEVDGLAEWRSPWSQVDQVREVRLPPSRHSRCVWSVTAPLRIGTTEPHHQYSAALYGGLTDRSIVMPVGPPNADLPATLRTLHVLHLAWPERWVGTDPQRTQEVIKAIRVAKVPIVWTQHNLLPHRIKDAAAVACYAQWARAASVVIHHTAYAQRIAIATYEYGPAARHVVIPHGHWGEAYEGLSQVTRAEIERDEGWPPTEIRLGVVGQPRREKRLQMVVDAMAQCTRSDIQLIIRLDPTTELPRDHRIISYYGHLSATRYHRRMRAFDALIMPFEPTGSLGTGTAFDCIGAGVAAITSQWQFLQEVFDGSDICYGGTQAELTDCLEHLTKKSLQASAAAVTLLRSRYEWAKISTQTLEMFEHAADTTFVHHG